MLTHLVIKNYALIRALEFSPAAGLSVITGETGAGKSILLGAIGLLLGNRADSKVLLDENEKCVIEGTFNIEGYKLKKLFEEDDLDYSDQTTLRREISTSGKSRAFVNDTPVTLDVMNKIGSRLMDIHSQHETLELGSKRFQLSLVDSYAKNSSTKDAYQSTWNKYSQKKLEYENLLAEASSLKQEADFIQFQMHELTQANLTEGELEQLESSVKIMEHAEEIKTILNSIITIYNQSEYSLESQLGDIKSQLNSIAKYANEYQQYLQRFENVRLELVDLMGEIEQAEGNVAFDPEEAQLAKNRLSELNQLLFKHRVKEVKELIGLRNSLQEKSFKTQHLDDLLDKAQKEVDALYSLLVVKGNELSESRKKVFNTLIKQLQTLLKDLGIPDAQLIIDHYLVAPTPSGMDSIELLFSANKGVEARPLAQVASGGEFSRLMFSIKHVMAEKTALPTMILDEIDTGVSGEIAMRLGGRMKEMADRHQLICISHLPQIAAKADEHFFVYKTSTEGRTTSSIKKLNPKERIQEIAQMIGGATPSEKALENAREMLQNQAY